MKRCPNCGRWWENPEVSCPDCDVALERNEVEDDGFSSEDASDGFAGESERVYGKWPEGDNNG